MQALKAIREIARRQRTRQVLTALLATAIAYTGMAAGTLQLPWLGWLGHLELGVLQCRLGSGTIPADPRIVLVTITSDTPAELELERPVLPLPRQCHALLIEKLRDAGARTVVMDLMFTRAGVEVEDDALRQALANCSPLRVVLAAERTESEQAPEVRGGFLYSFRQPVVLPSPVPEWVSTASPVAYDPGGTLRGAILLQPDGNAKKPLPHLALGALSALYQEEPRWDRQRYLVTAPPLAWPVGEDCELLARWTPQPDAFTKFEYAEALKALLDPGGSKQFRDKIVLVGDVSGSDTHKTPLGRISGVEFVGHALNTLLHGGAASVGNWSIPANAAWSFLLTFFTACAIGTLRPRVAFAGVAGGVSAALVLPSVALALWGTWIDTVGPCLALFLGVGTTLQLQRLREGALLRRYAPRRVVEEQAGTRTEVATVLFLDLRSSTTLANQLGPELFQELLTEFLGRLARQVARFGGEVERTLGDGFLAVFREGPGEPHAVRCGRAALALRAEAQAISNAWQERHKVRAEIGVGFEAGIISGGVISAGSRDEWSSFGSTVILACRIQEQCPERKCPLLLGPTARSLVQHCLCTEFVANVALKGVPGETAIYRLVEDPTPSGSGEPP